MCARECMRVCVHVCVRMCGVCVCVCVSDMNAKYRLASLSRQYQAWPWVVGVLVLTWLPKVPSSEPGCGHCKHISVSCG